MFENKIGRKLYKVQENDNIGPGNLKSNDFRKKKEKKNHQRHFLSIVIIDSLINHYKGNRNSA